MKNNIIITNKIPGGNINILSIENFDVFLEQEIRDTTEWWFYFSFKVKACKTGLYTFHFCNRDVISKFGPAISDDGIHYYFEDDVYIDGTTFKYYLKEGDEKYFAFSYPYTSTNFDLFLKNINFLSKKQMSENTLKNRNQYVYTFGNPKGKILSLTCRHHACEASASYVLEGAIEELKNSKLKEKYLISIIPFVDLDGVEDGDQGKSRAPHDHNRDYIDEPIYSSIRYIKSTYTHNLAYFLDLHCPGKWGTIHDFLSIIEGDEKLTKNQHIFSKILEKTENDCEIPYSQQHNIEYLKSWNLPSANGRSFFTKQNVKLGLILEIPYFGENKKPYSINGLNLLGHNLIKALEIFDEKIN